MSSSPPPAEALWSVAIEVVPVEWTPGCVGGAAVVGERDGVGDVGAATDGVPGASLGRGEIDHEDDWAGGVCGRGMRSFGSGRSGPVDAAAVGETEAGQLRVAGRGVEGHCSSSGWEAVRGRV